MQSNFRSLLLLLAFSAPAVPALAQPKPAAKPSPPTATAPLPAPVVTSGPRGEQFILGPDDVISLQVANHPEMSAESLALSSTGRVALPVLGPLTIKGKTLEQARRAIAAAYKSQLRDPKVSVTLVRARPRQATVLGDVGRPGAVDLQPGWRVSEVLAAAGGLNQLAPEDVTATLKRVKGAPVKLDIKTIYRAPENAANPRVNVGDVISVTQVPVVNVTINGDVGKPGPQESREAPRLLDALGRAGDLKFVPADNQVTLFRDGKIIPIDVVAAFDNPQGANNIALRDGDLLSVLGVRLNVNVISDENLVKQSGNYQLDGRSSFTRAISAAGGLTVPANKALASIRRGNEVIPVDLDRALYDPKADIPLQNNDIILIKPVEGPRVRLAGEVKTPELYTFKEGVKVMDAVFQAGGLTLTPENSRIAVIRTLPDNQQITFNVDANRLWRGNDLSQNVTLQDGDLVIVNGLTARSVSIVGEVTTPGAYELKPGDGLTEVMLRAQGALPTAALSKVVVTRRDGNKRIVDYSDFGKGDVPDVKLEDGDIVRVPFNPNQVRVMNAVVKPGDYAIPEGGTLTLGDALLKAGGTERGAKTNEIVVLHPVSVSKNAPEGYTTTRVAYNDIGKGKANNTFNLVLQPGDVVFVPEGKVSASGLQKAALALSSLNVLRGF